MIQIIGFLYGAWKYLAAICAVLGVTLGVVPLIVQKDKPKEKSIWPGLALGIFTVLGLVCAFVGIGFTEVPKMADDLSIDTALATLEISELRSELLPGLTRDGKSDCLTNFQSIEAKTVVPKGTTVWIGYQSTDQHTDVDNTTENSSVLPIPSPPSQEATEEPDKSDDLIPVPDVTGMEQIAATELLEKNGLVFQVWWTEENNIAADVFYVIGQSIPDGSSVPAGTVVQLEISPYDQEGYISYSTYKGATYGGYEYSGSYTAVGDDGITRTYYKYYGTANTP